MNCKKCGNTIPENSAFCPYCGTPADANTSMESANQQAVYQQQPVYQQQQPIYQQQQPVYQQKPVYGQPYNPAQKKSKAPLIIALSVILLLIITAVVLLFVFKPWDSGDDSVTDGVTSSPTGVVTVFTNALTTHNQNNFLNVLYPAIIKSMESKGKTRPEIYKDLYEDILGGVNPDTVTISQVQMNGEEQCSDSNLSDYNNMFSSYEGYIEIKSAYEIKGTLKATITESNSSADYDCSFKAVVAYCNGKYYIIDFVLYS